MTQPENGGATIPRRVGTVALVGAVACGACCALPFALPAVSVALGSGAVQWSAGANIIVSSVALLALVAAWLWVLMSARRSGRKVGTSTMIALGGASTVWLIGLVWPWIDRFC